MCPSALSTLYFTNCISLKEGCISHCFYALYFIPLWEDIWGGIWREALGDNPSRLDQRHPPLPRISLPSRISYKHQQQRLLQQQQSFIDVWGHLDEEAFIGTLLESGEFAWQCFLQNIGFIWKMLVSYEKPQTYSNNLTAYSPPAFSSTPGILTQGSWRTRALPPPRPCARQVRRFPLLLFNFPSLILPAHLLARWEDFL